MQKIRKILDVAPEKNSGQTNKETEGKKQKKKTEGKYFISPSLYGSNEWISVIDTNKCKIAHEAEIRQRLRLYLFTYETFLLLSYYLTTNFPFEIPYFQIVWFKE